MTVRVDLRCRGTGLPIADVRDEARILAVIGVVVEADGGGRRRRRIGRRRIASVGGGRGRGGRWSVLARAVLAAGAAVAGTGPAVAPLRAAHSGKADALARRGRRARSRSIGTVRRWWRRRRGGDGGRVRDGGSSCRGSRSVGGRGGDGGRHRRRRGRGAAAAVGGDSDLGAVPKPLRIAPHPVRAQVGALGNVLGVEPLRIIVRVVSLHRAAVRRDVIPLDEHQLPAQIRRKAIPVLELPIPVGNVRAHRIQRMRHGRRARLPGR
mmetsp:Transcript_10994/g.27053  ORF Transcript_10994/g.27053 Transcript_10994/m.27053 type:complete len:266 (+) Transcript_10994:2216-3013(+)